MYLKYSIFYTGAINFSFIYFGKIFAANPDSFEGSSTEKNIQIRQESVKVGGRSPKNHQEKNIENELLKIAKSSAIKNNFTSPDENDSWNLQDSIQSAPISTFGSTTDPTYPGNVSNRCASTFIKPPRSAFQKSLIDKLINKCGAANITTATTYDQYKAELTTNKCGAYDYTHHHGIHPANETSCFPHGPHKASLSIKPEQCGVIDNGFYQKINDAASISDIIKLSELEAGRIRQKFKDFDIGIDIPPCTTI